MNAKTQIKVMVVAVVGAIGSPLYAADKAPERTVVSGEATPKLYSFDYFKGAGTESIQFLERYNVQKGSDSRSGSALDLDLSLVANDGKRNVLVLEREGFGVYNHRGTIKANSDTLGLSGYYTDFRSASNGFIYRYSPGVIDGVFGVGTATAPAYALPVAAAANTNTGYVAQFNNDSPAQTQYKIDRTSYGLGLALKPALLGKTVAAAIDFDGYERQGNRFASFVLGGSNVASSAGSDDGTRMRWRGVDKPVDERMSRYTLSLNGAPGGFALAYEGALEKFDNRTAEYLINDIPGVAAAGTPRINFSANPIHFVPDSTLITNNVRLTKRFGNTAVAAGYGLSVLDQDSFSQQQQTLGYSSGRINTNSAYLNVAANAFGGVGLEGFIKYNDRKNDSSFPVAGLISPTQDQTLDVRVDRIKALNYGVAATFRPGWLKSTLSAGWKHEDKDRDLTWSTPQIPLVGGVGNVVLPQQSLYSEKTASDELYVNLNARPMAGLTLRVSPSYTWAGDTGTVIEPEKSFGLKTKLSYAAPNGMLASGYYNYRDKKNADHSVINNAAAALPAAIATAQDVDRTQQAAGASLNLPVNLRINTSASLSWMQDDFASYYLRQGRRRFEAPNNAISFIVNDRPNFKVETYVLVLGGDWQVNDGLRWSGSYTRTQSKGHTASGDIQTALAGVDDSIDSTVHSFALGADYVLRKNVKLKASYIYEYNKDASYVNLTGGYHTLMMGVGFAF